MNIKTLLIVSAVLAISSAHADSVSAPNANYLFGQTQVAINIAPDEVPPVDEEELEELLGQCPVYPACPPIF